MANGDGITYTVKELLQKLDEKVDGLSVRLDRFADRAEVEAIGQRVTHLEGRFAEQRAVNQALREQAQETKTQSATNFSRREKVIAVVLGVLSILLQVALATGVLH